MGGVGALVFEGAGYMVLVETKPSNCRTLVRATASTTSTSTTTTTVAKRQRH